MLPYHYELKIVTDEFDLVCQKVSADTRFKRGDVFHYVQHSLGIEKDKWVCIQYDEYRNVRVNGQGYSYAMPEFIKQKILWNINVPVKTKEEARRVL